MSVCVTGVGAITALGESADATFAQLLAGAYAFEPLTLFDATGYRVARVAEVRSVGAFSAGDESGRSRTSEMAIAAAREALVMAGLSDPATRSPLRVGLVVGSTTSGMFETEALLAALAASPDAQGFSARRLLSHPLSAATERVDAALGPFDRMRTLSSACSSGANALIVGATWIELGLVDVCLAGAADGLCRVTLSGFGALGALDPEGARPFDRDRRGLTLGEGAGFVVLERGDGAEARAARAVAWLSGWAAGSEAHHVTNPEPTGATPARVMMAAMALAEQRPEDIDYINAHGTGTPLNDAMEARAIRAAFGAQASRVPVSSVKGQIGHTLAASGAIEAVITTLTIARGELPPSGRVASVDPACDLAIVRAPERRAVRAALSSSFGFGGMDAALVFSARPPPPRPSGRHRAVIVGACAITPRGLLRQAALGEASPAPVAEAQVDDARTGELDPDRARRLDRASRLACLAASHAGVRAGDGALVLGAAFGSVDGTAAFVDRVRVKGARLASPAEFPSLVPSAPAGHLSTYLGTRGASCVVADLEVSGEAAFAHAVEWVESGAEEEACACAVQEKSVIVDGVLAALFAHDASAARREGAGAIRLLSAEAAERDGVTVLARVEEARAWRRGDVRLPDAPAGRGIVVTGNMSAALETVLAASAWAARARIPCASVDGAHEAVGLVALARAACLVASGAATCALVLGGSETRGYATLLCR